MTCKKFLKMLLVFAAVAIVMLLVYMPNGINEYANSFRNVRALGGEALLPLVPVLVYGFVRTYKDMKAAMDDKED